MRVFSKTSLIGLIAILPLYWLSFQTLAGAMDQVKETAQRSDEKGWKLPEHEKLTFRVKWLAITAGEITVEIKGIEEIRGRKAYKIEAHARTTGFCSTVYKVDSRYVSYLDVEKLYTLRHEVHRREGSYKKDAVTDFDQETHKAHYKSSTDGSEKTFSIPSDTQATITALYIARLRSLTEKNPLELKICNNERNYEAVLKVVERTSLTVPGRGKREVLLIRPIDKYGKTVRQGRMSGYVSVEPGHEPYLFIIKAPVFTSVTAHLVATK
jgi:hypothetical protein